MSGGPGTPGYNAPPFAPGGTPTFPQTGQQQGQIAQTWQAIEQTLNAIFRAVEAIAAGGGGGGGGGGNLATISTTLTSTQLLTTSSAPTPLVAAPGPNKLLVVINSVYLFNFVTTPYAEVPFNGILYGPGPTAGFWPPADAGDGNVLTSAANQIFYSAFGAEQISDPTLVVNKPLYLGNSTSDPTGGDGTLNLTFSYITLSI